MGGDVARVEMMPNAYNILVGKIKGDIYLRDLYVDGRMLLK
jgi:hypothetical protein